MYPLVDFGLVASYDLVGGEVVGVGDVGWDEFVELVDLAGLLIGHLQ